MNSKLSTNQLSEEQLSKLNAVNDYFGEPSAVRINDIELTYYPQSPESAIKMMMILGETLKKSQDLKKIVTEYFPQLDSVYEKINYFTLMEIIGTISEKMLLTPASESKSKN